MPDKKQPIEPGQVRAIPASNYDITKDLGRVIDRTRIVNAPQSPNLLFGSGQPFTGTGDSKVNPSYAIYLDVLKNSPANPLQQPYFTDLEKTERYTSAEFGGYNPYDLNQENWYGENQSWLDQWGNRIGKFVVKALGGFANSLMDAPNAVNAVGEGNMDKMWDNPTNNWATDLMEWSEKALPNYQTNWEREHPFMNLIPFYGNSGNGWGKVFENVGFTVGAIGGAIVEDLIVGALTGGVGEIPLAAMQINKAVYNLGKLINKGDDAMSALKTSIKSADDLVSGLKGVDRFNYAVRQGLWGANMITSGFSEAAFEGIESHKTLSKDLRQEFFNETGRVPDYEEAQKIESTSRQAANSRFLLNSALLAATNTIQWGSLIRPFNVTKELVESEVKSGIRVSLKEGSRDIFEAVAPKTFLGKVGRGVSTNKLATIVGQSAPEGFEEGTQFWIQQGVDDYYKRKYDNPAIDSTHNFMKSFSQGLSKTLGTTEGWENIVMGLLGGAMYKGGEHIYYRGRGSQNPDYKNQVEKVVQGLNSQSLSGIFENKYGEAVTATSIENDMIKAANTGNNFLYQNYKHEQFVNFMLSGITQNKYDTRLAQLEELKKLDDGEFAKTFGIPATSENRRSASMIANRMQENAGYIKDVHDRVKRTFINPFSYKGTGNFKNAEQRDAQNTENEKYLAYEQVKDQLVYGMSITKNSSQRISGIRTEISQLDSSVNADLATQLGTDEGLQDLKADYRDRIKDLEASYSLVKERGTKRELDWHKSKIAEIDEILGEKDSTKQQTAYAAFIEDVFDRIQEEKDTTANGGKKRRKKSKYDKTIAAEILTFGKDIGYIQKRNEAAVSNYATLTTKGGFQKLYDNILDLRKEAAERPVDLQPETTQPTNPQANEAFKQSQAAQGIAPTANPADATQAGFEESVDVAPNAEELKVRAKYIIETVEGRYTPDSDEQSFMGFQTIDDLKFDNPKVDLTQYSKGKGDDGKNIYTPKSNVDTARQLLATGTVVTTPVVATPPPPVDVPIPSAQKGQEPLRIEDFLNKAFVPGDLKTVFQNAIWSGNKDQVKARTSVTAKALDPALFQQYIDQKTAASYTPVPNFPNVFVSKAPIDLSMSIDGVEAGKIPFPERLLFNINNQYLTLDKITPDQYATLTGRPKAQYAQDAVNYNKYVMFKNLLALRFKNNENKPITLTPKELSDLIDINITYGELDLVTNEAARPLFNALKYKDISLKGEGNTVVSTPVILSIPKRYVNDSQSREKTEFVQVIANQAFYDTEGVDDRQIRSWINVSIDDLHNIGSRYIGVIQKPNGLYQAIALRPATMQAGERDIMLQTIKNRAELSAETNMIPGTEEDNNGKMFDGDQVLYYKLPNDAAKKFNDEFNSALNDSIFIADAQGKSFFNLSISPVGAVRLEVFEPVSKYSTTLYIAPHRVGSIKDFDGLIAAFNKQIENKAKADSQFAALKIQLSSTSFKQNIDVDANVTTDTIGSQLTAATTTQVFKNGTLRIDPIIKGVNEAYKQAGGKIKADAAAPTTATQTPDVAKAAMSPQPNVIQGGIFNGLTQVSTDDSGAVAGLVDSNDITSSVAKTLNNQEALTDQVFASPKEALAAAGVGYRFKANDSIEFFDMQTNQVLDYPGASPMDLVKDMNLKIQPPKKGKDTSFDFKIDNTGAQTLDRMINFEAARSYIYSILPSFISVEDIDIVIDKIIGSNTFQDVNNTWGAFQNGTIYLNRAAEAGVEYHEAFHAVFNMILTDEQRVGYLKTAQSELYSSLKSQGKSVNDQVQTMRSLGYFQNLNTQQAQEKLYEEYMADRFMRFKQGKDTGGFFSKLFSLLQRFFKWLLRDKTDLDMLFRNIDRGKYKYSQIASNSFTNETNDEYNEAEFNFMLVPARPGKMQVGRGEVTIKRNLDAKTSKQAIQSVASYFNTYKHLDKFSGITDSKLLDTILDDLNNLYSINNPLYAGYTTEQMNEVLNSDNAYIYSNDASREVIKEGVKKYIDSINYIEQFNEDEKDSEEQDTGQPSTGYDNSSENQGGFSSLPGLLRQYIGFTTFNRIDDFGNKELIEGVPVVGTVDSVSVYYGLMRSLANITDPVKFFQKMILFSDENEQSRYFVEKFISDTGLNVDVLMQQGRLEASKNKTLVELVKKGFNKFRIDYIFTEQDIKKGAVKSYHANRKNVENVQFDKWANSFVSGYSDYSDESQRNVRQALTDVKGRYFDERRIVKFDIDRLNTAARETQNALRGVGINLSKAYIKYTLLSKNAKKYDEANEAYKKEGLTLQFDDPANKFITKQDYDFVQIMKVADEITMTGEFLEETVKSLAAGSNPYFKATKSVEYLDEDLGKTVQEETEVDTAMIGRILNVAKGNALFDESVGESSYTNAEDKVVYAHQDGTFHVKFSYQLRDANYRKQLRENGYREEQSSYRDAYDSEWLTNNFLLNSTAFENIADNLLFQRIDGMRAVETNKLGKVITEEFRDQKEGATYGHYSPRETLVNLVNLYVSYAKEQKVAKGTYMTAPHLIRVLEASKTADTVNLPINVDVYRNGTITAKAVDQMFQEFKKEFNRIQRVEKEIGSLKENLIENYHTGSFAEDGVTVTKGYRGLKFSDNITPLNSKVVLEGFERQARAGESLSADDERLIKAEIAANLNKMVEDTVNVMVTEGVITRDDKGVLKNVLLHSDFFKGNAALNLTNKFKDNIGHVIINDYINTLAYNQILHGDAALSLKNDGGIDAVKRAKGDNAAIVSMRTDLIDESLGITKPFTHSSVAIFKEPIAADGTKIADAQMYTTVEGLRYTMWGLGRLTPRLARVLDALETGENIHALKDENGNSYDAIFDRDNGLLKWDEMTNSLKLVYKDGKSYFKMSVVVLQPTLTSYIDKQGNIKARPGWETLHNLRTKMEADGIQFAAPESASKMMTIDVSRDKAFSDLKGHLFDNTFFGLQTVNPSNKLEITTPTQLLQLIDSEQSDDTSVWFEGKETTVKAVKNSYQDYVSQKVNSAYEVARNEIYEIQDLEKDIEASIAKGEVTPRLAKFQKRALETLEVSGADAQLMDFFALDENGAPKFNLNMSATKTKFGQLYLAYFSKGILSQKSPGYTVALMSGIDTKLMKRAKRIMNGEVVEWDVIRREQFDTNYQNVQNESFAKSINEVTEAGQYFLDELRYNVPEYDNDGNITGYFSEMVMPAHYKEMMSIPRDQDLPEAITKQFGVRIPSQDKHSFMSFKMVDFLPANLGSTGMFPKELIALSGADFDIDKEYITRYDFYTIKDKRGNTIFKKYGDATSTGEQWEEYKMWMSKNNKVLKSIIKELGANDPDYQRLIQENKVHDNEDPIEELDNANVVNAFKEEYKNIFITQGLKQMGLPSTVKEYEIASAKKELNNGVLNNRILDSYIALLTNSGMRDIASTAASLTALQDIQFEDDITLRDKNKKALGSVFSKKTNYPVDSVIGKYYSFRNNTTGKDNIGIDVNANLIYSVFNKGKIALIEGSKATEAFIFDDVSFDNFGGNNQYNLESGDFDGIRTNDILSTLISSATDEAKEQLNALYGLGVDALKVVNYLIGLKVPLKTAIYMVNQPAIRNYLEIKKVNSNTLQTQLEENTFKSEFRNQAVVKMSRDIKDYDALSDDELYGMFEREGKVKKEC